MRAVFLDLQTFSQNISLSAIKNSVSKLDCFNTTKPTDIIERCLQADIIITNKVVLTAALLKKLPQLKLICIAATGMNNIDLVAAKKLGITVKNVSGYAGLSVAQYVFAQMLEFFNQTSHHNNNTDLGHWSNSATFCYHGNGISELAGKTLGIIGYGNLGKAVAKIAHAFDMNILVAERPNAAKIRAGRTAFDAVVKQADVLTLHCPQTPETEQLVNQEFLNNMSSHAMLINTARGALVDNEALLEALKNNTIACAVLDVLDQEPPPKDHPVLTAKLPNLKITAHIAWASIEAQQRLLQGIAINVDEFRAKSQ